MYGSSSGRLQPFFGERQIQTITIMTQEKLRDTEVRSALSERDSVILASWETIRRYWPRLLLLPLMGLLLAGAFLFFASYEWQAQGTLLIGKVGNESVEPSVQVVERVKLQPFKIRVLEQLGVSEAQDKRVAELFRDGLQIRAIPASDLLEIRTRGFSREEAARNLQGVVDVLVSDHTERARSLIARLDKRMAELGAELDEAKRERDRQLEAAETGAKQGSAPLLAAGAVSQIVSLRDAEIRDLTQRRYAIEELLKQNSTFPTRLLEAIHVPEAQAFPKRSITLAIGLLLGLSLAVVVAALVDRLRGPVASR